MARARPSPHASLAAGVAATRVGRARLPAVDDRLAPPETRLEYLEGIELFAAPADPAHATLHAKLAYLLEAHVAKGYVAAVDLLTRTDEATDFAPDASIYPVALDRRTGGRRLEELAFELSDKQALSVATKKARELARRGVRRVFCLRVGAGRLLEWSRATDGWQPLANGASVDDRCLVRPLAVRALVDAAAGDASVVAALRARRVPALEALLREEEAKGRAEGEARGRVEGEAKGRAEGEARGRVEGEARGRAEGEAKGRAEGLHVAIADLCELLGIALGPKRRARLAVLSVAELDALRAALKRHRRWPGR
jgi:putative restriction endonuclease